MKEVRYTKRDIEIIKKYYHTYDFELINSMLDNPHSVKSIKSKAHRLGITSLNQWSEDEINILKANYSTMTVDDIAKLLPNRSNTAIISTAIKLGIKNQRKWQDWQVQYIVDNWELEPDKIMCQKIFISLHQSTYVEYNISAVISLILHVFPSLQFFLLLKQKSYHFLLLYLIYEQ